MALRPNNRYPGQSNTPSAGYPGGSAKDVTVPGDGTGFPLQEDWVNDLFGLLQSLLSEAGITASDAPDEVGASDYMDALESLFSTDVQIFTSTTSWTKPAHAKAVHITLVGWGGSGGKGSNGGGGAGGGGSGQLVQRTLRADDVPATLDVTIDGTSGGQCVLSNGSWVLRARTGLPGEDGAAGKGGAGGGPADDGLFASSLGGSGGGTDGVDFNQMLAGGGGGSDDGSAAGGTGGGPMGGAGGAAAGLAANGKGGATGLGYGAGGGGGGGASNPNGGGSGGGGASGWGPATATGAAGADASGGSGGGGGAGGQACILIVTYRGLT